MNLNSIKRELFWKTRSNLITPSITVIQKIIGNSVQKIINNQNHQNIYGIHEKFNGKTISIVGNSGSVIGKGLGNQVDESDYVLRFNRGVDKYYLSTIDTGIKTNLWSTGTLDTLIYQDVSGIIEDNMDLLIPFPFIDSDYKNIGLNITLLNYLNGYRNKVKYYMDQELYDQLHRLIGKEPSSGFVFINYFLLKTQIEKISLYGFDFSTDNRITGDTFAKQHDFNKEKSVILDLIEKFPNKIQMY